MFLMAFHPLAYKVGVHSSCLANETRALSCRHLVDRTHIPFQNNVWMDAVNYSLSYLVKEMPECHLTNYQNIINAYSGAKKFRYNKAWINVQQFGFQKKWSVVSMFVKPDKYPLDALRTKAPRAIQFRTPEFNLMMAHYLKDFEEKFYELGPGVRSIAKGRNAQERASDILAKWEKFDDPVVYMADHSAFDSSIRVEHLRACHKIYRHFVKSKTLKKLLQCQINNKGYSKSGIKYKISGTRMSGDFDTGLGNSLVNWITLRYVFRRVKSEIYLDGDDSLVFLERRDLPLVDVGEFAACGFETKIDLTDQLVEAEFCQSKLVRADPPIMVRNPYRLFSHFCVSLKRYPAKWQWVQLMRGKIACEEACNRNVPGLGVFFRRLQNEDQGKRLFEVDDEWKFKLNQDNKKGRITQQARVDLAQAWGLGLDFQSLLESGTPSVWLKSELSKPPSTRPSVRSHRNEQFTTSSILRVAAYWATLTETSSDRSWACC